MQFTFRPVTAAEASAIAGWRYGGPYAMYDGSDDPALMAELTDPANPYYAALTPEGDLAGYFCYGPPATVGGERHRDAYGGEGVLDVGLGLRPDLTGRGLGGEFVRAGLDFALARFASRRFRLSVAAFNRRAITVYERAGFRREGAITVEEPDGGREFVIMSRDAAPDAATE
ncbi:MAG TPA: GNAT family protein [Thermomicrobiales bacterium]|nr:GNAT family protein [Thermomicrobiales bacterium]